MAHWDPEFETPRQFHSRAWKGYLSCENIALVQALQTEFDSNEEESSPVDPDLKETEQEDSPEYGVSAGDEDEDEDPWRSGDTVRNFMRGGGKDKSQGEYRDQALVVEAFCEGATLPMLETGSYPGSNAMIALLDDMENKLSTPHQDQLKPGYKGTCTRRAYESPFTHRRLLQELRLPRFPEGGNTEQQMLCSADRRIIFITNLDPWSILTFAATASIYQAPILSRTIYHHLTARSVLAAETTSGFKMFNFELSMPFCAMRHQREVKRDGRTHWRGEGPLRRSWSLSALGVNPPRPRAGRESSAGEKQCMIYESQISISVSGIDTSRWIAWGFADDWFDGGEDVRKTFQTTAGDGTREDPLALCPDGEGMHSSKRDPRQYFLWVVGIRMGLIRVELDRVIQGLKHDLDQSLGSNPNHSSSVFSSKTEATVQQVREMNTRFNGLRKLVQNLLKITSRPYKTWELFIKLYRNLFEELAPCGETGTEGTQLSRHLFKIERQCCLIEDLHKELQVINEGLDFEAKQLASRLAFENSELGIIQHKLAEHLKNLGWITMLCLPPGLVFGLFSMPESISKAIVRIPLQDTLGRGVFITTLSIMYTIVFLAVQILQRVKPWQEQIRIWLYMKDAKLELAPALEGPLKQSYPLDRLDPNTPGLRLRLLKATTDITESIKRASHSVSIRRMATTPTQGGRMRGGDLGNLEAGQLV